MATIRREMGRFSSRLSAKLPQREPVVRLWRLTAVINAYNLFAIPKLWGSGKSASADGTKWDLYEQNLLSEYHIRYGGYRPMVFMQHGLMVGLFMTAATLCGVWLRRSGSLRTLFGMPLSLFIIPLFVTTLLVKSVGAIGLLLAGMAVLYSVQLLRARFPYFVLAAVAVAYVLVRMTGVIPSNEMVALAKSTLGADRAQSLESRLVNEDMLTVRALERPLFGWGGWGRARIYNAEGQDVTITDSLWIITLGNKGLFGLAGLLLALLLPPLLLPNASPRRNLPFPVKKRMTRRQ